MEIEELEKRLNWLDSERQKDKKTIAELQDSIEELKEENSKNTQRIKTFEAEIKNTKTIASRVDKIDADFSEKRVELVKQISEFDKKLMTLETKLDNERKSDSDQINKRFLEYQVDVKVIPDLKKSIQARVEEEVRINQKIDDVAKLIPDLKSMDSELQRQQKLFTNDLIIENKRSSDLQIETSAIKKRIEEDRNLIDLYKEIIRKLETKINEIAASESERKQDQMVFLEKQNLVLVEKENLWKEWQKRFVDIESVGSTITGQLQVLEETHRSVKRSQAELDEVNERLDRRINEITEMNRLSEERFRQEWVAFKADDQKRWTNYNLSREEELRDGDRQVNRITDRLIVLEDLSQELRDTLNLIIEETQKQFKSLLSANQDLLDSYSQALGKNR